MLMTDEEREEDNPKSSCYSGPLMCSLILANSDAGLQLGHSDVVEASCKVFKQERRESEKLQHITEVQGTFEHHETSSKFSAVPAKDISLS
eukprot:scaffold537_cov180-Ochromonas_danica.AAC.26